MPTYTPGLFVVTDGGSSINLWSAGARLPWAWTTGEFIAGDVAFMKRPSRIFVDCSGQVAISVIADGTEYPLYTSAPGTVRGRPLMLRLPREASIGTRFAFKFEGQAGAELHGLRVVGD